MRSDSVTDTVSVTRRYARCKRCKIIIGLTDFYGANTMVAIQRVRFERIRSSPSAGKRKRGPYKKAFTNRSSERNKAKKRNVRAVDAEDWSDVSVMAEQKVANLTDFESVYSPGRGNVCTPSEVITRPPVIILKRKMMTVSQLYQPPKNPMQFPV